MIVKNQSHWQQERLTGKRLNPLFRHGTQFFHKQRYHARCVDVFLQDENASQVSWVVHVTKYASQDWLF